MQRKRSHVLLTLVCLLTLAPFFGVPFGVDGGRAHASGTKLTLTTSMIALESGSGDPGNLVDEQGVAGDPLASGGGKPMTDWHAGYEAGKATAAYAVLDLGMMYDLSDIYLYDTNGMADFTVYAGSPGHWTELFSDGLVAYNSWNAHAVTAQTRYLRFRTNQAYVNEVVVYGTPTPPDTAAPAAVANLATGTATSSSIPLSWTAPGDDGNTGTATSYEMRYSTSTITSGNWSAATPIAGVPAPAAAGTSQSMTVTGLPSATTYYFAMKSTDESSNASSLSNVASGTTSADTSAPRRIDTLQAVSATDTTMTLLWKAVGDDNNTGLATSYDVRYNTAFISSTSWPSSTQASGEPVPAAAGTTQSMTITGLTPNTTYYFAIKAVDDVGNVSSLSTTPSAKTLAAGLGDTTAPADIADLAVSASAGTSLTLTWTATGDDGTVGLASAYDVRYSTSPIDSGNWGSASVATGVPSPGPAGTIESMIVSGLSLNTTYYFAIKATDEVPNSTALSNAASGTTAPGIDNKIAIAPEMVFDETAHTFAGKDGAAAIADEQERAGDPKNDPTHAGSPTTNWYLFGNAYPSPHNNENWWTPASAYIDLGQTYHITKLYFFDGTGSVSNGFEVATGSPFHWTTSFTDSLGAVNKWVAKTLETDTRYVRVTYTHAGANVNEVVLYGWPVDSPPAAPTPQPHTNPVMEDMIGTNAFNDDANDPNHALEPFKLVREYHNWSWDAGSVASGVYAYPDNLYKFAPSYAGGGSWNFDSFYAAMSAGDVTVSPSLKGAPTGTPDWLASSAYNTPRAVPDNAGYPSDDARAYAAHADYLYQYAARYGSTAVDDANLRLASGQPRSTGLGTLQYIEDWNEQNNDWSTRKDYFTPYEYAAMLSADYDGHEGQLGDTFGVKNADPDMKLALSGLAGVDLSYLGAVRLWAEHNRSDGSFPADAINFHVYCHTDNKTAGVSPEACGLKEIAEAGVLYRDTYLPGKEVWISEFGYDTHPSSVQRAPAIGVTASAYEVQGEWLVRSYLALAAAGVDKSMQFMLRDADTNNSGKYSSSGVVGMQAAGYPKKIAWYYIYTLRHVLTGMRYLDEQASGNANVMIYKFKSATDGSGVYAIWSPTGNGTTVSGYELALAGSPTTAELVEMQNGDTDGVATSLSIGGGSVTVDVSERPVFVKVDDIE